MSRSRERGAVAVVVAIMLVLLFVCVALVVDIGHIHSTKVELQRAVDAAALAAAQQLPGGSVVATAQAFLLANQIDSSAAGVTTTVTTGTWNTAITQGQTAATRFTPGGTNPNAVLVAVTRNVEHFFFFFSSGTTVIADAIALVRPINPVLPLAMVTCTLPGDDWELPDMTITGITSFEFAADDTGAWTSLTIPPANAAAINDLIVDPDKLNEFNSVIYGFHLNNDGIENTAVDPGVYPYQSSYRGCRSEGLNITCGLGRVAGKDIAAPEEFTVPPNLVNLDGSPGVYQATSFDPLTDFASWKDASGIRKPGALPRWYNLNQQSGLQSDDYFARILTQDGILLNSGKLETYYNGAEKPLPLGSGDDRFRPKTNALPTGGDLIICDSKGCRPNYANILKRAGYPQVYLSNGVSTVLVQNFLDKIGAQDGNMTCSEDEALPDAQRAVLVKAPVIYVGACEDWKANSSERHSYVGLTKFLITRIWVNNTGYDCPGCELQAEDEPGPLRIEGLQILPVADDQDDQASLPKYYLVE